MINPSNHQVHRSVQKVESLIDFLLMCLSIDIDEASPLEDEEAAQRALRGPHRAVNEQNGV